MRKMRRAALSWTGILVCSALLVNEIWLLNAYFSAMFLTKPAFRLNPLTSPIIGHLKTHWKAKLSMAPWDGVRESQ